MKQSGKENWKKINLLDNVENDTLYDSYSKTIIIRVIKSRGLNGLHM
jgi:hypothetical protein